VTLEVVLAASLAVTLLAGAVALGRAAWSAKQREASNDVPIRRGRAQSINPDTELR